MKINMQKVSLYVIFILIVICTGMSISYAYFIVENTTNSGNINVSSNIIDNVCLDLTLSDNKSLNISGEYSAPLSENKVVELINSGDETFKYSFSVKNNCNTSIRYYAGFLPTKESNWTIEKYSYILTTPGTQVTTANIQYFSEQKLNSPFITSLKGQYNIDFYNYVYKVNDEVLTAGQQKNYDLYIFYRSYETSVYNFDSRLIIYKTTTE